MQKLQIEISTETILKAIFIILAIWFLFLVKDIILLLFVAIIISSAIEPIIDILETKKIPRVIGVMSIYLLLFFIIGLMISFLIPPITYQLNDLSQNIPQHYQKMQDSFKPISDFFQTKNVDVSIQDFFSNADSWVSRASQNIFSTTVGVFSGLISTIVVLSLAFYMTLVKDGINKFVALVTPGKHQKYAIGLTIKIKHQIGKWLQGQLMLMLIIFILDFIGLSIIGIPYALVLAVIAGLLEIIPYIGPVLAAIPGIILGFLISPLIGLLAFVIYFIVQQAEGHILTPLIMKKAVGLNPVAVILALLAGAKLGGILGAIIAIPVATALGIFIKDLFSKNNKITNNLKQTD